MINTEAITGIKIQGEWIRVRPGSFRLCDFAWPDPDTKAMGYPGFIATLDVIPFEGQMIEGIIGDVQAVRRLDYAPGLDPGRYPAQVNMDLIPTFEELMSGRAPKAPGYAIQGDYVADTLNHGKRGICRGRGFNDDGSQWVEVLWNGDPASVYVRDGQITVIR